MKKRLLLTLLILTCISVLTGKRIHDQQTTDLTNGPDDPRVVADSKLQPLINEFEAFVRMRMEQEGVPGAAIAIVKDTNIIYLKGFGLKERNAYDSVDVHTVFRLASLSKGFAPVLAATLVQEGKLHWDDRVIDYVPDFSLSTQEATQNLTLRNVLSHATGLPRHTYSNLLDAGLSYADIRPRLSKVRLIHPVGTTYDYQNVAYSLIGDAIEKVSGKTYQQLLRERILQPIGMRDASVSYEEMIKSDNVAIPHRYYRSGGYQPIEISPRYYTVGPAAGVNASAADMARWMLFLLHPRPDVLAPELLDQVFSPNVDMPERDLRSWQGLLQDAHYAMGWRVLNCGADQIVYHGGYVNSYRSEIALIRKDGLGIAVLTNAPSSFISNCLPFFFDMYQLYKRRQWDPMHPLANLRRDFVESMEQGGEEEGH